MAAVIFFSRSAIALLLLGTFVLINTKAVASDMTIEHEGSHGVVEVDAVPIAEVEAVRPADGASDELKARPPPFNKGHVIMQKIGVLPPPRGGVTIGKPVPNIPPPPDAVPIATTVPAAGDKDQAPTVSPSPAS